METLPLMTFPSWTANHMKVNDYAITENMNFLGQCVPLFLISPVALCFLPCFVPGEFPTANTTNPAVTTPAPTVQPHSCPDREFVCVAHGECVANSKVCDFRRDCSDGSDELNCGKTFIFSECLHRRLSLLHCNVFTVLCLSFLPLPSVLIYLSLSPVKEWCDFEGGDTCGWNGIDSSLDPIHAFRWSPDHGVSIHDGEQYHRPINDHTL